MPDDEFEQPSDDDDAEFGDDEPEIDEDEIDDEEIDDDSFDDDSFDDEDDVEDEDEDAVEDAVEDKPAPRARSGDKEKTGDEEDDDEVDPDDVEADLDTILKDRLEAYDDEDEEEEEDGQINTVKLSDLPSKREGEFPCPSCFLLVNAKQVARSGYCPHCGDPITVTQG